VLVSLLLVACRRDDPPLHAADLGPAGILGRHLAFETPPDAGWVECTSPDDPAEDLLVETVAANVDVYGLLPDTAYDCALHDGAASDTVSFRTDPWPDPVELTVTGETDGYTLVNTQFGVNSDEDHHAWVIVVDPDGRVRWLYDLGPDLVCDIDAQYLPPTAFEAPGFHLGGGWASFKASAPNRGTFLDVDLDGTTRLERAVPDVGEGFNHHCERLDDGTTLSLTGGNNSIGDHTWVGVTVEQWSPADGVVWSWDSQQLVDEGLLPEPTLRTPYTANAVALVDDPYGPGAWISIYTQREMWRIDRNTGEMTHHYPDGFTVVDRLGRALGPEELTYDQHDPEWVDGPLGPDTRVLMYDNGNGRPGGSYSRVVEYDVNLDTKVMTKLWDWTEDGWWNPTLGDADRLPNGHVLVTKGFNLMKSPTSDDVAALVEIDPTVDPIEVVWRLAWGDNRWNVYRSERLDACAPFADARYCRAVADRLDELHREE
jgi:hypothetical protein